MSSTAEIDCGDPPSVSDGNVVFVSTGMDSRATYTCDRGYRLQGSSVRTCQDNEQWSAQSQRCISTSGMWGGGGVTFIVQYIRGRGVMIRCWGHTHFCPGGVEGHASHTPHIVHTNHSSYIQGPLYPQLLCLPYTVCIYDL